MGENIIKKLRDNFINEPTHKYMGTFEVPVDENEEVFTLGSEKDGPKADPFFSTNEPRSARLVTHQDAHEYGMDLSDKEIMQIRKEIARDLVDGKRKNKDLIVESDDEYTLKTIHDALIYIINHVAWYREKYEDFNFSVNDSYILRQIDLIEIKLKVFKR